MWYTVAKVEFGNVKVGTIFAASKTSDGAVLVRRVKFSDDPKSLEMVVDPTYEPIRLTQSDARQLFISPSKDLAAIVEASIVLSLTTIDVSTVEASMMLSESAYC